MYRNCKYIDCDVKPCYKESVETGIEEFNSKVKESSDAVKEKEKKYSVGTVKGFIAPRLRKQIKRLKKNINSGA